MKKLTALALAITFLLLPADGMPASAHHRRDPTVRSYVEGFCYIPQRGRVILSAVAIMRRYIEGDETRSESTVYIAFYGDKHGGPEKWRVLGTGGSQWDANLDGPPHWESYQSGEEFSRNTDNFDRLRVGLVVAWGSSLADPNPHHFYSTIAQWVRGEGCEASHDGSVEQP